ncbi:hypothetical protein A9K71_26415 [Mesorhizobium sp. WSM3873]|nr:hypothetical protein A9K71_26415 [Mesorhizobium sp. WSM3873]
MDDSVPPACRLTRRIPNMLSAMDQNKRALERAFDLAQSGVCVNFGEVRTKIKNEGYDSRQMKAWPFASRSINPFRVRERMPIGPKGQKRPADVIGNAVRVMRIATWRGSRRHTG